ncbi:MAG: serine hydrolase, partial [Acidobacteriota bacterium]|nr:serine hydrolase [Acidobacteriota bacterium]
MTLDNWQQAPHLHWSFLYLEDLFPTARISRGDRPAYDFRPDPQRFEQLKVEHYDGTESTVADVMASSETDGWIVARDGAVLAEHYLSDMAPDTRHLLMSVSKSLVGAVAASLIGEGELDPERLLSDYVPELAETGWAGATVRHVLDMRSGIRFSEEYLNPNAEVRLLEQAIDWAPRTVPGIPHNLYDFLLTLPRERSHGGAFDYRSGESDMLGWICEAASGQRMPELMSELLWSKLGAELDAYIGVDSAGTGMFDGGICAALRDLARFGSMLVREGTSLTGDQVLPAAWIEDCLTGDPDSRAAFGQSHNDNMMPGGMYRNQFWLPYPEGVRILVCLGIHGQMIYANLETGVVA